MFNNGHRLAHVCLRCRRNLARQSPLLPQSSPVGRTRLPFPRHQITAAARIVDDNYDEPEPPVEVPENQPTRALFGKHRNKHRRHRQFKPTPTAGLGVQTLGKPSEIILLPDRDRIIPESATGDDAPQQHLSEALEEEKKPAPWEQVKEHIDQTRAAIAKQQGSLDEEEWQKLRSTLRQQFTRYQLKRYIREVAGDTVSESLEKLKRPKLAVLIATRVWGYGVPEMKSAVSTPQDGAAKGKSKDISKKRPIRNKDDLLLFRRNDALGFSGIARETNTSISVGEQQSVKVTGSPQNVALAMKQLDLRKVRLNDISLEGFGEVLFADGKKEALNTLLKSIGSEHSVVLRATAASGINARHFRTNEGAVANARRHLRSTAKAFTETQQPSVMSTVHPDRVRLTSYPPVVPVPWSTKAEHWARAIDATAGASRGTSRTENPGSEGPRTQWSSIKNDFGHPLLSRARQDPNAYRCELSTRIGVNLHHIERMAKAAGSSNIPAKSWFVDEAPLVAQLLASNGFSKLDVEVGKGDVPIPSPLLTRVLLSPVALLSTAPVIEIYLYGANRSLGMQQALNVARITAVTDEKTLNMSLPALPVDMSWTRHLKQDLFVQSSPGTSKHPNLLQDLGKYLAKARKEKHEQPQFASFEEFIIPPELLSPRLAPGFSSSELNKPRLSEKVEYTHASAEILDVQHHTVPIPTAASPASKKHGNKKPIPPATTPQPVLRYTTFQAQDLNTRLPRGGDVHSHTVDAAASDSQNAPSSPSPPSSSSTSPSSPSPRPATPTRERHELSLVESPLLSNPAAKSPSMDDYRRATIFVAERIAELGRGLRIR